MQMDGRRAYCCTFCKGPYYTQLRDALYCAECFEKHVSRKFRKSLGELPKNSNILVVIESNMQSVVMAHLLSRLVPKTSSRTMHYFVASQNSLVSHFTPEALVSASNTNSRSCEGILGSETRRLIFDIAKKNGFAGILVAESLENVVSHSFVSLLHGKGREAIFTACTQNLDGICLVNALSRIPKSGISGYFFLYRKELPFLQGNKQHTSLQTCIEKFLENIRLRNCGAHNNFVETLCKANTQDFYFCTACCLYHRISETCV